MSNDLISQLKALKLHGMAQTLPELMTKARSQAMDAEQVLQTLLAAESTEREVKSLAYQMKAARFPAHRDLAGFDFTQARVDEVLVRRLHGGEFMSSAQNVVLIPSGHGHWRGSDPASSTPSPVPLDGGAG